MVFGLLGGLLGDRDQQDAAAFAQIQGQLSTLTSDVQGLMQQAEAMGGVPGKLIEISTALTTLQNNFIAMQQQNLPVAIGNIESDLNAFKSTVQSQFGAVQGDITALQEQYTPIDALRNSLEALRDDFSVFANTFPAPPALIPTGVLRVSLVDAATQAPIPNADVRITFDSTVRALTTDSNGQVSFLSVPVDKSIWIRASRQNYSIGSEVAQVGHLELKDVKLHLRSIHIGVPPAVQPVQPVTVAPRPEILILPQQFITVQPITSPVVATPVITLQSLDAADNSGSVQQTNQTMSTMGAFGW